MATDRRRGVPTSEMRFKLVEALKDLLRDEGAASISTRSIAEKLGLKRQIVNYYFHSVDDLFVLLVASGAEDALKLIDDAIAAGDPLRAVWELNANPLSALLAAEINALALRHPALRQTVQMSAMAVREAQIRAVLAHREQHGIQSAVSAEVTTVMLTSIFQSLAIEAKMGIDLGHVATLDYIRRIAEGKTSD